jgi:two-component system nitrate/nitrite sensor histidine kinase NarX
MPGAAGGAGRLQRWLACVVSSPPGAGGFLNSPVCRPLAALLVVLVGCLACAGLALAFGAEPTAALIGELVLLSAGVVLVGLLYRSIDRQLLAPLGQLRDWARRMRAGELGARLPVPPVGDFRRVAGDINDLGDALQRLSEQMDQEVSRHTDTLAQKTRSLQVLYDVAASINLFNDLDDLLTRFLHTLIDVVRAQAAAVRLLDKDGQMRLVASVGLSDQDLARQLLVPLDRSVWGAVVARDEGGDAPAPLAEGSSPIGPEGLHTISVPLRYHGKTLGVYNLFVDRLELAEREDVRDLLTSIGRHLGMAIEKVRVDAQAQRLSIMQERNLLAHELHDSLAQTLASLRFQVRMLDDTLGVGDLAQAHGELDRIRNGLEEANAELRGLLAHFRAPIDRRGLLPALEDLIGRFRRETGVVTFFQKECAHPDLPATQEMQVLRIVQEALANIRKHSQAHAVRILLRCDDEGHYHVMVEDDGIGIGEDVGGAESGEHIGLAILQERARRLGGTLTIESEPAEGTRVELNFTSARAQ